MFSVYTTPDEYKNATITGHFGFVFEENSVRGNHMIILRPSPFSNCPLSTRKNFKFLRFEERFRNAPFCDGLVWTVGLTAEIKAAFLNSSGVVKTGNNTNILPLPELQLIRHSC